MDLGTNLNSTQQISKPDPEFENASDQIEIDFCISFDVLLILESQRGWCELSKDGSYSSVAKLMYSGITLDLQLKKIIPVGYLSKVNFRGDSRHCPNRQSCGDPIPPRFRILILSSTLLLLLLLLLPFQD